jgi:hypothetical protein
MKIATRLALLQFQANPADPSNFTRLMIAWIIPGMREPVPTTKKRAAADTEERQHDDALQRPPHSSPPVRAGIKWNRAKLLAAGVLLAAVAVVGAFWVPSIWDNYQRQHAIERVAWDMEACGWGYDESRAASFVVPTHLFGKLRWSEAADLFRATTLCGGIAARKYKP